MTFYLITSFGVSKAVVHEALNACVHVVVVTIDEHRVLYHNAMCIDHCCVTPNEMVSIRKGLKNVTWSFRRAFCMHFETFLRLYNCIKKNYSKCSSRILGLIEGQTDGCIRRLFWALLCVCLQELIR